MDHDYIMGLHYAVVEAGGFVRFPMGVEAPYLVSMGVQERGNLLAHSTMGAASYMELVRQRSRAAPGEATDVARDTSNEAGESESGTDDADVATDAPPNNPMQNLLEELKIEHKDAIERGDSGEERGGMGVHAMTLEILQAVRAGGINPAMVDDF